MEMNHLNYERLEYFKWMKWLSEGYRGGYQ